MLVNAVCVRVCDDDIYEGKICLQSVARNVGDCKDAYMQKSLNIEWR